MNILPRIDSWYWWQTKITRGKESLLLIKTSRAHLKKVATLIKEQHSYDIPELIALPIHWGEKDYLQWVSL